MDKAKRDRLAELRKKKILNKATDEQKRTDAIVKASGDIAVAVKDLHKSLSDSQFDKDELIKQIKDLQQMDNFKKLIKQVEASLGAVKVKNFEQLIKSVDNIKLDNSAVVKAITQLTKEITDKQVGQEPEDFTPTRRVRKVGNKLIFDDEPLRVSVSGGGGGGIPTNLIDNDQLKTTGLTDAELRATPLPVSATLDKTGLSTEAKQDAIISAIGSSSTETTYDIRDIDTQATYKYFGFGERGGTKWRIMRKELATSSFRYAVGATDYATNWTNRGALLYV